MDVEKETRIIDSVPGWVTDWAGERRDPAACRAEHLVACRAEHLVACRAAWVDPDACWAAFAWADAVCARRTRSALRRALLPARQPRAPSLARESASPRRFSAWSRCHALP